MRIVSTSKIQRNISLLSDRNNIYTVVKNGEPQTMIIPYYEGLFERIEEILEDLEMEKNKEKLVKKGRDSLESGLSDLVI